jgi:hypothetical protein
MFRFYKDKKIKLIYMHFYFIIKKSQVKISGIILE